MTLLVLAYLGGVLTIISPCILPVLPFVFARADRPFVQNGLPMLAGMALTFAVVATFAAVAGGWVVDANEYGRCGRAGVDGRVRTDFAISGIGGSPDAAIGRRRRKTLGFSRTRCRGEHKAAIVPSLLLGVATGFLWAPCAGPVLGPHPDRSGPERGECKHVPSTPRLRSGRGDVAGSRPPRGRPGICCDETFAGCG
jgi:cytochrome c biogenesis protein CcdA